jgi:hypothetical protein
MKLASNMLERTLDQFEAQPLPDTHPAVPKLEEVFGEHTFFLNEDGLHIVEPTEPAVEGDQVGSVLRVARWNDDDRTGLLLHEPEPSDIVIDLGREKDRSS